ncbi:MAG: MmgE/PrpD family protein, partial [Xanthobacteraceae bacterium]
MNAIDELAGFIVDLEAHRVARGTLEKLRLHVADTIGAWMAATETPEGKMLIAFAHQLRPRGDTFDRVALHCALTRLSEIDDIHLASMTTPGSIAIPAALTLASEMPDVDCGDVAAAILAGYEAMIRFGLAVNGPSILYRGIWPTYFAAGIATAAVAARLMRLDRSQTAHALAMAIATASPTVGQHHAATTARWFLVGNAARSGLAAAAAAQAGFTADAEVLQSPLFSDVYGIEPDVSMISQATNGEVALAQVSFKPWCAARQTMAATQAFRELVGDGVIVADITDVTAYVLRPHLKMIDHGIKSGNRASFLTSLPYQLAMAALYSKKTLNLGQPAETALPAVQSFMQRINVVADDALLAAYPSAWPARIVVTTTSDQHECRVRDIPGDPARPFSEVDIRAKFQYVVAPLLGEQTAAFLQSGLTVLSSRNSLSTVMQHLSRFISRVHEPAEAPTA